MGLQIWCDALTEEYVRIARAQMREQMDALRMPPDSQAVLLCTLTPIGEKNKTVPAGDLTRMALIEDQETLPLGFSVPTQSMAGGLGLNLVLFGRIVPPNTEGPLWVIPGIGLSFQPWCIRVSNLASPLVTQIMWTPDLRRAHKSFEWVADEWDDKLYDKWQKSAGLAMKFLHKFERYISTAHRPAGSYDLETVEEYAQLIYTNIYSKPERDRGLKDAPPATIAAWLGISESSIDRYRTVHGIGIRDIRSHRVQPPGPN